MPAIFDAHMHIIDPDYPLIENQGYLPGVFTVEDYLRKVSPLGVKGGAVVSGSFQGFDQSYLVAALDKLGDNFVGVTQLPVTVNDQVLTDLHTSGIRALRFNVMRGGSESVSQLEAFSKRVYDMFGWHVELYAGYEALNELKDTILRLPKVSIDHLGLNAEGLPLLHEFVAEGCFVKVTGFGRLDFDPFEAVRSLYQANPSALVFGTDLPSTRAPTPFREDDLWRLSDVLTEKEQDKVCWTNALCLYGLSVD